MTQNSSSSNPSEEAAVRVQHWLGKDKELLVHLKQAPQKTKEFYTRHQCTRVSLPRALSLTDHLRALAKKKERTKPLQVSQDSHSKPFGITVDQPSHIHQKDLKFFQMEIALSESNVLCIHKEHLLATRRLKSLPGRESAGAKRHQIVSLRASSSKGKLPAHPEKWERFKEERHFQISRM